VVAQDLGKGLISFHVLECRDCEFAWQWPLYREPTSSVPYFQAAYEAQSAPYFQAASKSPIVELQLDFLNRIAADKGRLLDIGSGDGAFCRAAFDAGWDVLGVDPAGPTLSEHSEDGNELHLIKGNVGDVCALAPFDAVTMWDIIEHVERPLELIRVAKEHLRPGGRVLIETGNYQSAGRIEAGAHWWCYQTDHRWYFSPPVINRMLQTAGFDAITLCERILRPWWVGGLPKHFAPILGKKGRS
jgi:2-polyprenyl-3-methyl-5-hydroxy-6-metoxy-1,4-benzoquinol methylase